MGDNLAVFLLEDVQAADSELCEPCCRSVEGRGERGGVLSGESGHLALNREARSVGRCRKGWLWPVGLWS